MLSNRADDPRRAAARRRAARRSRSYAEWEAWVERLVAARRHAGLHAGLVGRPAASAARDARGAHRRPADGARADGARSSRWCASSSSDCAAGERRRAPTTCRTAGRRRARAATQSSCIRTATERRPRASSPRELLGAEPPEPEAHAQLARRASRRRGGPRRSDGTADCRWRRRPRRSRSAASAASAASHRLAGVLTGPRRPRVREREPHGPGHARLGRRAHEPRSAARGDGPGRLPRARASLPERNRARPRAFKPCHEHAARVARMSEATPRRDASSPRRHETASVSRRRRSALADQVYRVARRLVASREEAEDLVQETYARAFRSWHSYTPGHEPARLAAAHPHEPQHRPRPSQAARAGEQPLEGTTTSSTTSSPSSRR